MSQELGPWQQAWVASLRSGDNPQGRGLLCCFSEKDKEYFFCCLGIACEVLLTNEIKLPFGMRKHKDEISCNYFWYGDESTEDDDFALTLPIEAVEVFCFYGSEGTIMSSQLNKRDRTALDKALEGNRMSSLAGLNDTGWTFEQIADLVERFPKAFFSKAA